MQPLFEFVETSCGERWPTKKFIREKYGIKIPVCGVYELNLMNIIWRTGYVIIISTIAMILPFFNDIVGLMGALSFWPLTIYFPIEMYIAQGKVITRSYKWYFFKFLSFSCFIVSVLSATASLYGIISNITTFKPFQSIS